jgi:protein subunit release factor B
MSIEVPRERSKAMEWESGEKAGQRSLTFDVDGVAADAVAHKSAADITRKKASFL